MNQAQPTGCDEGRPHDQLEPPALGQPRRAEPGPRWPAAELHREFHAEAGAPEGALYLDGRFVGWIQGVNRL